MKRGYEGKRRVSENGNQTEEEVERWQGQNLTTRVDLFSLNGCN